MNGPPEVETIPSPRRCLFLGGPDSGILTLLKDLTGSAPDPRIVPADSTELPLPSASAEVTAGARVDTIAPSATTRTTTAGLTHTLLLRTKYYNADVPCWLDEPTNADTWGEDFTSAEAGEVVRAVGAWVVVFREENKSRRRAQATARLDHSTAAAAAANDGQTEGTMVIRGRDGAARLMRGVRDAIEAAHDGPGVWDGVCLVVGMPASSSSSPRPRREPQTRATTTGDEHERDPRHEEDDEEWEDLCFDLGFEYVRRSGPKSSALPTEEEQNSREKTGVARVLEALEACEWEDTGDPDPVEDELGLHETGKQSGDDETLGFGLERAQMEVEFAGLKHAMLDQMQNGDHDHDEEDQGTREEGEEALKVEELERMMSKMTAVRDMSAHMPEQERRRLAARTVNDIMRTM